MWCLRTVVAMIIQDCRQERIHLHGSLTGALRNPAVLGDSIREGDGWRSLPPNDVWCTKTTSVWSLVARGAAVHLATARGHQTGSRCSVAPPHAIAPGGMFGLNGVPNSAEEYTQCSTLAAHLQCTIGLIDNMHGCRRPLYHRHCKESFCV